MFRQTRRADFRRARARRYNARGPHVKTLPPRRAGRASHGDDAGPEAVIRPPFYGWIVVAGGFLVLFMAYGTQYAFGIFFGALLGEFGWSRASLSGAFSLYTVAYSACGLAAGRLTDRWGPRTVIALGGVFLGAGLIGMSGTTALWQPYVMYGIVLALGLLAFSCPPSVRDRDGFLT
jgi:sugar phosphate permease